MRFISALLLALFVLMGVAQGEVQTISWKDLLPKQAVEVDDPFAALQEGQLLDLGMIARIRFLLESEKISKEGPDAAEEKRLVEKLTGDGIDVEWILSQRERVAKQRKAAAERVDEGVNGQSIRIPGYMLPLAREDSGVTEFLLVPWVGACIHTPPPPPNQMIHVSVPEGTEDRGRFAAIWLEGAIELKPDEYDLFLVDGTRKVKVAYTLSESEVTEYSAAKSDELSKVEIPEEALEGHNWWQRAQARVSLLFTKAMTDIRDRESSGPLWIGLLIAFVYGVVHTLGPGHGKAVVVSYFAGHGGSFGRGLMMGTQIAVFHVLSAILVVWVTDFAVRQATGNAPSDYRLIKLISYAAIAGIGGFMLWKAIRSARVESHHNHDHGGGSEDHHHDGCHACEAIEKRGKGPSAWLALAVGSVPCTGALLVLLFGMANDLLGPAIFMVVAISFGMAVAMSGIGVLAILGRRFVDRRLEEDEEKHHRFACWSRIAGAAAVLLIGVGLFSLTLSFDSGVAPVEPKTAQGIEAK